MHIQRHTHTSTHVQSTHMRNGDNQGLVELIVRDLAHTKKKNVSALKIKSVRTNEEKTDIHESESKEKIRAHRASSKATRLFLTK